MADKSTFSPARLVKHSIPAAFLTAGKTYKLDAPLAALAEQFAGSPAYLRAIRLKGNVTCTVDAAVNGQANHKFMVQRALRQIRLVVNGHEFYNNIDGEDLAIDYAHRTSYCHLDRLTFAALATGTQVIPVEVWLLLDEPGQDDEARNDNVIPVACFNDSQNSFVEFTVGNDLSGGANTLAVSTGFASGLDVHFYIGHRDNLVIPQPWRLSTMETAETRHIIRINGGLHYLYNANRATSLTRVDHTATDWQSLSIGNEVLHTSLSSDDYFYLQQSERPNPDRDGSLEGIGWATTTVTTDHKWCAVPLVSAGNGRRKTKLTRGDVAIQLGSIPAGYNSRVRYLYRETGTEDANFTRKVGAQLGVSPTSNVVTKAKGASAGGPAGRILPMKIQPTNQTRFAAINAKVAAAAAK